MKGAVENGTEALMIESGKVAQYSLSLNAPNIQSHMFPVPNLDALGATTTTTMKREKEKEA